MKIISANVLIRRNGSDVVSLVTNMPSPTCYDEPLTLVFKATKNTGIDYVKNNFAIEPETFEEPEYSPKYS